MKDKEQGTQFSRRITSYFITFKIVDNSALLIEVDNSINFERHRQIIDYNYISSHADLKIAFEKPLLIMEYLITNFSQTIVQSGLIRFQHKGEIYINIQLAKVQINPLDVAKSQIARIKRQFAQKESKMNDLLEVKDKQLSRALSEILVLKKTIPKSPTLPSHLSHFKRVIPGSLASPNWYDKQNNDQRQAIVKQIQQFRSLQYKSFIQLTAGLPQTGYKTSLYHIGQLSSPSFFFAYTFLNANAPQKQQFVAFLKDKFNPSRCLVTLESKLNEKTFYVMVIYDVPKAIRLYQIKHPKQVKVLSRLTWSIKHLEIWMSSQGSSDRFQFGNGQTIEDYSKMHDRYKPEPVQEHHKQAENTQSSKKTEHEQTQDSVIIKSFEADKHQSSKQQTNKA